MTTTTTRGFQPAPTFGLLPKALVDCASKFWLVRVVEVVNRILQGKLNVTQDVTLTANATSTVLTNANIGNFSAVIPATGLTANGAAAIVAGIWVSITQNGQATLNHANSANIDQTIRFVILG